MRHWLADHRSPAAPDGSAAGRSDALAPFLTPAYRRWQRRTLPDADLISSAFDLAEATETREILILLSTPRSGSTMLCDLLRENRICVAHEYFNPACQLPLFAERVGAIKDGRIDKEAYLSALYRLRTMGDGVLGINIHGQHLWVLELFRDEIERLPVRYFYLSRRDREAQAVSYALAAITGQWSSDYPMNRPPRYEFDRIRSAFTAILLQEQMIEAFLAERGVECPRLWYEDLAADPARHLSMIAGPDAKLTISQPRLRRQGGDRNAEFVARFRRDLLAPPPPRPVRGLNRLRRLRRRFF